MVRAAGGEVVTRLAEVESGVTGAAGTHWDTGTCCTVCTAPQSTVQCLVLHSDTISSGDNDGDGLQRTA